MKHVRNVSRPLPQSAHVRQGAYLNRWELWLNVLQGIMQVAMPDKAPEWRQKG